MWELLNNAWNGWGNYIFYGKYPALLLLVLVVFWFFSDRKREQVLLGYTTVMTVCCICPLTAVPLMLYQTKFYDYQWVWSYVPLTIVVAFAGTLVLGHCRELTDTDIAPGNLKDKLASKGKVAVAALMIVILILLCGRMTDPLTEVKTDWMQSNGAKAAVEAVAEIAAEADDQFVSHDAENRILLWAPKEVMAAARMYCPDFQLPYGRDLWDASLGAYTYDTYTEVEDDLCQWMHCAGVFGTVDGYRLDGTVLEGKVCMKQALELGVNCIVVPAVMTQEAVAELETILEKVPAQDGNRNHNRDVQIEQIENYYLFTWN